MPFKPGIQTSPLTISTLNHEKRRRETTFEKKEAIVGQVSINFLQKEARLNVSGLLKCSFHRGEAEKGDEGRGREEEEEWDRVQFFWSLRTPNSVVGKECTWLRICVRIVPKQKEGVTPVTAQQGLSVTQGPEESRETEQKIYTQRETSKSIFWRQISLKDPVPISIIKKGVKNKQVRDLLPCLTRVGRIRHMLTIQTDTERVVRDWGGIR